MYVILAIVSEKTVHVHKNSQPNYGAQVYKRKTSDINRIGIAYIAPYYRIFCVFYIRVYGLSVKLLTGNSCLLPSQMYMKFLHWQPDKHTYYTDTHATHWHTLNLHIFYICSHFVNQPKMLHSLHAYVLSSWLTMGINNLLHCKLCSRYIVRMFWTRNT